MQTMPSLNARAAGILAIAAMTLAGAPALAEPPSVMVIFDGSGSMWGKIEGDKRSRLVVAREAMRQALAKAPPETRFGLVSFGHRRGGDCEDVETLAAPESGNAERIGTALEKLNPRGKGPIAAALRHAAAALEAVDGQQSIILLHDDPDNCRGDPCAAAAEIRKMSPRLKVHVISIAMRKEEQQRMACIATQTGGRLFDGSSAGQLAAAIEDAVKIAAREVAKPPVPAAAKADPAAAAPQAKTLPQRKREGPPGLLLAAALVADGAPLDIPLRWRVARSGEERPLVESEQAAPTLPLPPGSYVVTLVAGAIRREATFAVLADGPTEATIVLNGGIVNMAAARDRAEGDRAGPLYTILGADAAPVVLTREATVALPPGDYVLIAEDGQARVRRPFSVKAGAVTSLEQPLVVGTLKLALAAREGGPALEAVQFIVYEDDPDAPQGRREVFRTATMRPEVTLPIGTYYVIARHGNAEARERIALRGGETVERTLVAASGRLALTAKMAGGEAAGELVSFRIERLDALAPPLIVSRPAPVLELAAGHYRIEGRLGSLNARIVRELEVKAGASQTLVLDYRAALVHVRLLDPGTGLAIADAFWEIRGEGGELIWATSQAEPQAALLAGRYVVRAEHRGRVGEQAIELKAGERRTIDISVK